MLLDAVEYDSSIVHAKFGVFSVLFIQVLYVFWRGELLHYAWQKKVSQSDGIIQITALSPVMEPP